MLRYNLDVSMLSDLRASRQSLMEDGRRSRASALQRSMMRKSTRASTRSRSRDKLYRDNRSRDGDRGSSGYRSRDGDSLPDSDNWAGTSTDNNWTDYDQDVYTVRSPQKTNRYSRDDVNLWTTWEREQWRWLNKWFQKHDQDNHVKQLCAIFHSLMMDWII